MKAQQDEEKKAEEAAKMEQLSKAKGITWKKNLEEANRQIKKKSPHVT